MTSSFLASTLHVWWIIRFSESTIFQFRKFSLEDVLLMTKVSLSLSTTGATPCSETNTTTLRICIWGATTLERQHWWKSGTSIIRTLKLFLFSTNLFDLKDLLRISNQTLPNCATLSIIYLNKIWCVFLAFVNSRPCVMFLPLSDCLFASLNEKERYTVNSL